MAVTTEPVETVETEITDTPTDDSVDGDDDSGEETTGQEQQAKTAVPLERLRDLNQALLELPQGFAINRKLERARDRRAPERRPDRSR